MRKILIGIPMYLSWAYALLGLYFINANIYWYFIRASVQLLTGLTILENLIFLFDELLTRQGFLGWIIAIWLPGQYFLSYAIYDFLKKYYY
jgi:hypothetical protein